MLGAPSSSKKKRFLPGCCYIIGRRPSSELSCGCTLKRRHLKLVLLDVLSAPGLARMFWFIPVGSEINNAAKCQSGDVLYTENFNPFPLRDLVVRGVKLFATCRVYHAAWTRFCQSLCYSFRLRTQFADLQRFYGAERRVKRHELFVLLNVKIPSYCDQIKRRLGQFLFLTTSFVLRQQIDS